LIEKTKINIKNKLKDWLEINKLDVDFNVYKATNNAYTDYLRTLIKECNKNINHNSEGIDSIHRTLENVIQTTAQELPSCSYCLTSVPICITFSIVLCKASIPCVL
jgi:hypothetical protein